MLTWLRGVCNVIVNFLFRSYFCLVAVGRYNRITQEFAREVDRLWLAVPGRVLMLFVDAGPFCGLKFRRLFVPLHLFFSFRLL